MRMRVVGLRGAGMRLAAAGAVMAIVAAGCGSDECLDNKNALPLAGFYASQQPLEAVSLDSISIAGLGVPGDSVLHDSVSRLSQSYLPFRIDENSTTYVIRFLQGELGQARVADTITFDYDIQPFFTSAACGATYNYRMRSISTTHNIIDSVTCPDGVITNANIENIKIYFRVAFENE